MTIQQNPSDLKKWSSLDFFNNVRHGTGDAISLHVLPHLS